MEALSLRPADACRGLLAALEASEGRRRRRKRDQTPDAIGLGIKRELLERAIVDDPDPEAFESWLLEQCLAGAERYSLGAMRVMAQQVLEEWRLSSTVGTFDDWLARGAPSDDRLPSG